MAAKKKIKGIKWNKPMHIYSDRDKMEMLNLYHKDQWRQSQIAEKFGTSRQNVNRILKSLEKNLEQQGDSLVFTPDEVLKRKNYDTLERIAMINSDAIEVVELTIALAKHKIKNTLKAMEDAGEFKEGEHKNGGNAFLDIEKLTRLLQTALPYVIPKPEQKKSDAGNKKPVTKLHKLMSNTIKRETA